MLSRILEVFQPRHLGLIGLCLLAWAYMSLFRYDNYGIEEGAALAILMNWSIVHQIASPVAFSGVPDLRAVMFIPLDMHWAGSLIAVKVFTMYILFGTALLMYRWSKEVYSGESSMIATTLLLLAPISLIQTDTIGSGIYLLFCFVVIVWLNQMVRDSNKTLPSWFFLQLVMAALAISMHPMGLAVPLALTIHWWRNTGDIAKARWMTGSIAFITGFILFVRWNWYGMDEASSPLSILGDSILGSPLLHPPQFGFGILIGALLLISIGMHLYRRINDPVSIMLIAASLIGLLHADHAWVFIAWASTLYLGIPLLIEINQRIGSQNLMGQRGILLLVVMAVATISMLNTRQIGEISKNSLKGPADTVISVLEREAADLDAPFIAASQWPARTLLVCRRDVLPLPPADDDVATFRRQTAGLTHIAFNHHLKHLQALSRNAASMGDIFKSIAVYPGGVVLKAEPRKEN